MRFRGTSIRRKIVALLLVPLLSLTAIWAFATVLTGREASRLFRVSTVVEEIGYPVEDTVRVLQQERRQTLVHLADPRPSDSLTALRRSRTATDRAVAEVRRNARTSDVREALSRGEEDRLTAVLDAFAGLESLRRSVDEGIVGRARALVLYNRLVDPCQVLLVNLHVVHDVELDKQYRALVNLSRARELLSREDALLGSALVAGRLTPAEIRDVSDLVAQRTQMYALNLPLLPASERGRYERFWKNASSAPLRVAEEAAVSSPASSGTGLPSGVTARSWDTAAGKVLDELGTLDDRAADRYQDRVRPVARGVIAKAVVAGVLGLLALLVSLWLSVRIGRGLVRDLRQLRQEAHEASAVRLPGVMRRLSAGEHVDVESEVPRLEYARNEIGEVGQALDSLQRAAVEAAVKQAELRAGVSEVFVNLARRSQVLLHKQLTLLDAMERRTEDTEELADLFRLDHLTTRMRRHAEGLVILSGAAPSRQWRRPIQLMDVVRAAVAEVEDYERIEVRRLPRIAVTGPAVADLTHLVAELLENATVFSPPHTHVQVVGERVANGFTLEIHDRGLGMAADALLDANLRLAETPEFEPSDTDRLGLFVVGRLARRQNVRVSLQPSPYGGITAVVFIPDALLTDDAPDTNGAGFRLDRPRHTKTSAPQEPGRPALSRVPGLSASLPDGPAEREAPVGVDAVTDFPGARGEEDGGRGGPFRPRDSRPSAEEEPEHRPGEARRSTPGVDGEGRSGTEDDQDAPVRLPRRRAPKLVSSHGRPVTGDLRREQPGRAAAADAGRPEPEGEAPPLLPARRREAAAADREGDHREPDRLPSLPARPSLPSLSPLPSRRRRRPDTDDTEGHPREPYGDSTAPDREPTTPDREPTTLDRNPALPVRNRAVPDRNPAAADGAAGPAPLPVRDAGGAGARRTGAAARETGPAAASGARPLPRRVRQASLAPQLRQVPERHTEDRADRNEQDRRDGRDARDAEEVRSRMAALQRGWRRGREENAVGDDAPSGTAPHRTTEGDGR